MDFQPIPNIKTIGKYVYNINDKLLNQEAFGEVYLGHDRESKQNYAIKVIPVSRTNNDPALYDSLMTEIQVMKSLKHPNILRLFDVHSSSNNHYFITEYCSGDTLSSYLKKREKIPELEALKILIDILQGYYEMFKLGIILRDLKPDYILRHEDVFKLGNFRSAKILENFNKDVLKFFGGTSSRYMSPQILRQQEYSSKSDFGQLL